MKIHQLDELLQDFYKTSVDRIIKIYLQQSEFNQLALDFDPFVDLNSDIGLSYRGLPIQKGHVNYIFIQTVSCIVGEKIDDIYLQYAKLQKEFEYKNQEKKCICTHSFLEKGCTCGGK